MKIRLIVSLPICAAALILASWCAPAADVSVMQIIESKPVFSAPIVWVGEQSPSAAESTALLDAINIFEAKGRGEGFPALESFLTAYPQSSWAPSLNVSLAEYYRTHGRYSLALSHWKSAWDATKEGKDMVSQKMAVRALAGWTRLLASLGAKEQLIALFAELQDRQLPLGGYATTINGTKGGLAIMKAKPGISYRCGSFALGHMAEALGLDSKTTHKLFETDSPDGGFHVCQLLTLAETNGLAVAAVRRPEGADLVVPAVVHWKLNHYAAIMEKKGNVYRVEDPTFEGHVWMDAKTIEAEASGEFILPKDKVPAGWQKLTTTECATIYGKGFPNIIDDPKDPGPPSPCGGGDDDDSSCDPPAANDGAGGGGGPPKPPPCPCGMPQWFVSEPYITLWLEDAPLVYHLSSGKPMLLQLRYKHHGESLSSQIGGFGDKWSCTWLGMLQQPSGSDMVNNHLAGGGINSFNMDGTKDYRTARKFVRASMGGAEVATIVSPTGSKNIYGCTMGYLDGSTNYFLTERRDRYGRVLQRFNYQIIGALVRMTNMIDLDGRISTLAYGNIAHPNLITAVTDPYGRTAYFNYDGNGLLTNIVDEQVMTSSFQYNGDECITNLITPYGTNRFEYSDNTANSGYLERSLLITEATGDHQLYVYRDNVESVPDLIPYAGDQYPSYRMSYHWNRAQYEAIAPQNQTNIWAMTQSDYQKASIKHWLHETVDERQGVGDTLSAMADPFDPALGVRPNCITYKYYGESPPYIGTLKVVTSIQLNGSNALAITRNDLGRPTSYTQYNSDGSKAVYTNIFDAGGQTLQHEIGPSGELTRGYGYDPVITNLLASVTNAVGEVIRYTHDTNTLKVTSTTFPTGLIRTNLYYAAGPSQGFLQAQIDIGFRTNYFTYMNGNLLAETNELGLATVNSYDNLSRLVSTAFPDGTTVSNVYDKLDVVATKDRLNQWTYFGYNAVRQLMAVTNANGQVTQYDYCSCGAPDEIIRWIGNTNETTLFGYDIDGRLISTTYADGYQVNRSYDTNSLLQTISDSAGRQMMLDYVQLGMRHEVAHAYLVSGGTQRLLLQQQFDSYGRVTNSVDRNGVVVTNSYDFLDRLLARRSIGAAGQTMSGLETFGYAITGLTNYTDQLGQPTAFVRDAAGRVLYQTNANNERLSFTYNPADELLSLTDGKNQTTSWGYDAYGQVTNKVDANSAPMFAYQYDADGRLTNRWQAGNIATTYKYDPIGNLTNIVYPTSSNVFLQYDALNELTNMADGVGQTRFTWTLGGQLASEDGPWTNDTVAYTYSSELRSGLSLQQPGAADWTQSYAYDGFGRLTNVTSAAGAFGYQYASTSHGGVATASDLVQKLVLPNGAYDARTYDDLARLTASLLQNSTNAAFDSYNYGYDAASQRTGVTRLTGDSVAYTYDAIGQLKTAIGKESDGTTPRLQEQFGYAYDAAWNLNVRTNNALIQSFAVNTVNELTNATRSGTLTVAGTTTIPATNVTVNGATASLYGDATFALGGFTVTNGVNTYTAIGRDAAGDSGTNMVTVNLPATNNYTYDARGNLLVNGTNHYAYDNENQLISVWETNVWREDYSYDGLNRRRITKQYGWNGSAWAQTNETHYIYDVNLVIQERSSNNVPLVTYTRGNDLSGGLQGAGGIGGLLARQSTISNQPPIAFYHADGNGNITCLMDTNQNIVARYLYDPFGNMLSMSGPLASANTYRFSSKEWNENAGLYYYGYRFYDPNLQRFINRDPIEEYGGYNLFAFVFNNPANLFDLFGACPTAEEGAGEGAGEGTAEAGVEDMAGEGAAELGAADLGPIAIAGAAGWEAGTWLNNHTRIGNLGTWIGNSRWFGTPLDPPNPTAPNPNGTPPGALTAAGIGAPKGPYKPLKDGAREFARRNGYNAKDVERYAHEIKKDFDPMSKSTDGYGTNPKTGEIADPESQVIGDLKDKFPCK